MNNTDDLVTLEDCPPGLFRFGDMIGFKSEYKSRVGGEFGAGVYQCDAYVVSTGEFFVGGAKTYADRGNLLVEPVEYESLAARKESKTCS